MIATIYAEIDTGCVFVVVVGGRACRSPARVSAATGSSATSA